MFLPASLEIIANWISVYQRQRSPIKLPVFDYFYASFDYLESRMFIQIVALFFVNLFILISCSDEKESRSHGNEKNISSYQLYTTKGH